MGYTINIDPTTTTILSSKTNLMGIYVGGSCVADELGVINFEFASETPDTQLIAQYAEPGKSFAAITGNEDPIEVSLELRKQTPTSTPKLTLYVA